MSAELFAEFGAFSKSTNHQPNPAQQPPASDPFSFFGSSLVSALPTSANNPSPRPQLSSQWQTSPPWPSSRPPAGGGGQNNSDSVWGHLSRMGKNADASKQSPAASPEDDDDGWGDFEMASPTFADTMPSMPISNSNSAMSKPAPLHAPPPPRRNETKPTPEQPPLKRPEPRSRNTDPNVLFDADDYDGEAPPEDDDEFGDFETVASPLHPVKADMIDLMSSDFAPSATVGFSNRTASSTRNTPPSNLLSSPGLADRGAFPQTQRSPSFQDRNPFKGLKVTTPKQDEFGFSSGGAKEQQQQPAAEKSENPSSPVTAWPAAEDESKLAKESKDDCRAFDDFAPDKKPAADKDILGWDWDAADGVEKHQSSADVTPFPSADCKQPKSKPAEKSKPNPLKQQEENDFGWDWESETPDQDKLKGQPEAQPQLVPLDDKAPPPTNIPPPSTLLSLFADLLDLPNEVLYKPTAAQTPGVKGRVLSDPATTAFLRAYLVLATVAARILAGRKHRWRRDKFLAQGMSISAVGVKGGGMKLAGVDKTQAAREDREAADVVALWRAHVGRLRAAVAAAAKDGDSGSTQLRVPEITEKPVVSTAKNVPTAPKACVVCGLKRDERVKGVDFEVEDSFGEWWVEHWGHRACRNFWVHHEAQLRQR